MSKKKTAEDPIEGELTAEELAGVSGGLFLTPRISIKVPLMPSFPTMVPGGGVLASEQASTAESSSAMASVMAS
jgi:hypothetical protein